MSDEVSDFLRSVELLKERREEEDEARSRELEEKILQEKKERQARRAERARSISPQKSSPANTPPPTAHRRGSVLASASDGTSLASPGPESTGSPRQRAGELSSEIMESTADYSGSPTKENDSPFESDIKRTSLTMGSPSIGMPAARSPLSWQRRPTSQASDRPKSRPLSMVAAENAARNSPVLAESAPATEQTMSRDQIAQSLAGKDPSWFRQTADPGRGSAAFRKNQVEDQDTADMSSVRTQLPGMSREPTIEPPKESPGVRPVTPTTLPNNRGSPLPLTGSQRLDPPVGDGSEDADAPALSRQSITSPPGRTSPTRPVSPTKGMGGFVQSAMMKRSDSVKRWSVNSPAGLQRVDSAKSNAVGSLDNTQRPSTPQTRARSKSMLREGPETVVSLPAPNVDNEAEDEKPDIDGGSVAPAEATTKEEQEKTTPPTSPSKTMDPRRWSPTKNSSWLEAALNKPESPKAKPTSPAPAQPAWMVELNKAKAQKASADLARSASQHKKPEIKTGGLMRSTPMGASLKPSALSGLPAVPPVSTTNKPAIAELRGSLRRASPTTEGPSESPGDAVAAAKDKLESQSKKDFRGNLKPRAPPPEPQSSEPTDELKNVFGSLRRTKTQNYVAPDELKDNILRGKAALNLTGGPKKTDRKDDFKEAILKKKEEFRKSQQEGRGVSRALSSASETSIPEGIAKKLELQRTGTFSRQTPTSPEFPLQSPVLSVSNRSSHISTGSKHDVPALGSGVALKASSEPALSTTLQKTTDAPGRIQSRVGGLAERFNPALAGLIARGPPSISGPSKGPGASSASGSKAAESGEPAGPGPQLTHMTKNRARGPRRKAPTSVAAPVDAAKEQAGESAPEPEKKPVMSPLESTRKLPSPPQKPEPFGLPKSETSSLVGSRNSWIRDKPKAAVEMVSSADSSTGVSKEEPKSVGQANTPLKTRPRSPTKVHEQVAALAALNQQLPKPAEPRGEAPQPASPKTRPRSPTKVHEQVAALAALSQQSPKPAEPSGEVSQPSSPRKLDLKRMSKFLDEQAPPDPKPEPVKSKPSSPVKDRFPALASPPVEKQLGNDASDLKPALPIRSGTTSFGGVGLGLTQPAPAPKLAAEKGIETEQPPPVPAKVSKPLPAPPAATSPPMTSPRIPSPVRSPGKQSSDVSGLINEFFGPERPRRKYAADAAEILMRRPVSTDKIQTQRAQLIQLTADGKRIPVPSHYERVLFEREMYICPHTYIAVTGRKVNEVYFWAGDEVPQSEVDDAHLFAAREARSFGGKLIKLLQGKETSEFLQALGGIVIIRRGSSNKYDSLAPNMLCGRRYLGQVAFDEVDFSPMSLCSGFPYLITQQGKCYLWKGKGSNVEELGCARLVGMDLALMGELLEVEEGSEPDSFWAIFGGITRPSSADHWRLKPNYDKYCGRLFCASAGDKEQITEISPFSQADLVTSNIYVLDAFFEMYIIVGARSQHQYAAFRNALDFAQEYAILAAGMEDRPFVPISTVVLEGIPRDMKSVFRKWRDAASPTVMHVSPQAGNPSSGAGAGPQRPGGLKRGRSLRIVPLTQALQALSE
ncbi:uncharacterized protein B0T15DRAFT_543260 [Chaetomium strumarium]|uniref:DUF4045 domain-containing protein n=1 Tax=Chaetomium strumarium TaxID=1170767 RepID=A0AAJ0GM94_9PEZI|nr:hypothetical protein B0T15DRAFT_543260 [Chaetomium strumarium]